MSGQRVACPRCDGDGCAFCGHEGRIDCGDWVSDPGAEWDRARDRDVDREAGVW